MAIQCQCPSCAQRFQVPESALGKRVKCPKCAVVIQLNLPKGEPPSQAAAPPQWFVRTADQKQHGPMSKAKLDQLVADGRLDGFCHVRQADGQQWKPIEEVYPQFAVGEDAPPDGPASTTASPETEPRLHPCPDCGKIISRRATECPNCGCPIGPPAVATLPRRTSSAPKPSGKNRNRKIVFLASAGVVLLVLLGTGVYVGVKLLNLGQSAMDELKLVTEPLAPPPVEPAPPPAPTVDRPTPEQIAACMKDSAAAMARAVDQRFEQEYNAVRATRPVAGQRGGDACVGRGRVRSAVEERAGQGATGPAAREATVLVAVRRAVPRVPGVPPGPRRPERQQSRRDPGGGSAMGQPEAQCSGKPIAPGIVDTVR